MIQMVDSLSNLLCSVVALLPSDFLPTLYLSFNHFVLPQRAWSLAEVMASFSRQGSCPQVGS